jgi:hypothetical protein
MLDEILLRKLLAGGTEENTDLGISSRRSLIEMYRIQIDEVVMR